MFLTLPWIVILAGLIYLVASKAGWLEAVGRRSQRRRPPGGGGAFPPSPPEVGGASGMLRGFVKAEALPFFFVFGYPGDSFLLQRFQLVEGAGFDSPRAPGLRGTPIMLGSAAAGMLDRTGGEALRLK